MKIPIRNLYFLLLYAWDFLDYGPTVNVGSLKGDHPLDLLAFILIQSVEQLLKHGLGRNYVSDTEITGALRGRLDFSGSMKKSTLANQKLMCHTDKLDYDVLANRIIRSTLRTLADDDSVDHRLRKELRSLFRSLDNVQEIRLHPALFSAIRVDRGHRHYALPLNVCRMIVEDLKMDEGGDSHRSLRFDRDEVKMRLLFQRFVTNLLRRRLNRSIRVEPGRLSWQKTVASPKAAGLIPTLNMDVIIEDDHNILIVDTKYTPNSLTERFSTERFQAGHIFQIYAYLSNYSEFEPNKNVSGLLLYPCVEREIDESFSIMDQSIRVATLALDADWKHIETRLISMVSPAFPDLL